MNRAWRHWLAAVRFLTIFPVPGQSDEQDLAASLGYFPLVGLLLGGVASGATILFWHLFSPEVAAVLLTAILLAFSGGLHLDGLADTADGLFSARPREQMLLIMRDSRIGTMGVVALIVVLMLKISGLASLDRDQVWLAGLLMPLAGRTALVLMMALVPYARPEGGLATFFYQGRTRLLAWWSVFFLILVAILTGGVPGLLSAVLVLVVVWILSLFCLRKIGGATGDTLGAGCELAETMVVLTLSLYAWNC